MFIAFTTFSIATTAEMMLAWGTTDRRHLAQIKVFGDDCALAEEPVR